jgi:septal ring factor EnvC (AmiA/AmiB activator)
MSTPNFNKTLNSLYSAMTEIKHLRTELEEKKSIISQLHTKIATLEANHKPVEQEVQSEPETVAFTGNWYDMASTNIASYVNPKTNRPLSDQKKILAEWKRCIAGAEKPTQTLMSCGSASASMSSTLIANTTPSAKRWATSRLSQTKSCTFLRTTSTK